jgi:hypothetical protein
VWGGRKYKGLHRAGLPEPAMGMTAEGPQAPPLRPSQAAAAPTVVPHQHDVRHRGAARVVAHKVAQRGHAGLVAHTQKRELVFVWVCVGGVGGGGTC